MMDVLERGALREYDLLRGRGYTQLLIKLVDKDLESGLGSYSLLYLNCVLIC